MLRDIADFFESLVQLAADPIMRRPAIVVVAGVGIAAFLLARAIYRKPPPPPLNSNCERELAAALAELERVKAEQSDCISKLGRHRALVQALEGKEDELWRLGTSTPVPEVEKLSRFPGRIITFANLKGGVGKTTLAANMAGYFATRGKRVLVIDLDYQGSLSDMLLRAAGHKQSSVSKTDEILDPGFSTDAMLRQVDKLQIKASPRSSPVAIDLLGCGYSFNRAENRSMLRWLMGEVESDIRFCLLRLLVDDRVSSRYEVIILDTPPRWSTGTINALATSTHLVVPTMLDNLASANVATFLSSAVKLMRSDLNKGLRLAGVIPTVTTSATFEKLNDTEKDVLARLRDEVHDSWGDGSGVFEAMVQDREAIAHAAGRKLTEPVLFEEVGSELCRKLKLT